MTVRAKEPVEQLAYNISDVAKVRRIGRATILRTINTGQSKTLEMRGLRRVSASEIRRVLRAGVPDL